jgi:predicted DNA-binding transcriptional regulator AlpA
MSDRVAREIEKAERLLSMSEVLLWLGISRATAYRWMQKGSLPSPLKLGPAKIAFVRSEIAKFVSNRPRTASPSCRDRHD